MLKYMLPKNVSLKSYNTFRLNYKAEYFIIVRSESEAVELASRAGNRDKPILVLGGGSNLLFMNDFRGTIIHPEITGINIEERKTDYVIISAGAGVDWDSFVEWAVDNGFGGIENLSHPRNCGGCSHPEYRSIRD